jgi:hypothetical protein
MSRPQLTVWDLMIYIAVAAAVLVFRTESNRVLVWWAESSAESDALSLATQAEARGDASTAKAYRDYAAKRGRVARQSRPGTTGVAVCAAFVAVTVWTLFRLARYLTVAVVRRVRAKKRDALCTDPTQSAAS